MDNIMEHNLRKTFMFIWGAKQSHIYSTLYLIYKEYIV